MEMPARHGFVQRRTEIVRALLAAGADVAAVDPGMKTTALHAATYALVYRAAKVLVQLPD